MTDELYIEKFLKAVKESKTDEEIKNILNRIYDDGFEDGKSEGTEKEEKEPLMDYNDLD